MTQIFSRELSPFPLRKSKQNNLNRSWFSYKPYSCVSLVWCDDHWGQTQPGWLLPSISCCILSSDFTVAAINEDVPRSDSTGAGHGYSWIGTLTQSKERSSISLRRLLPGFPFIFPFIGSPSLWSMTLPSSEHLKAAIHMPLLRMSVPRWSSFHLCL